MKPKAGVDIGHATAVVTDLAFQNQKSRMDTQLDFEGQPYNKY